MPSALPPPFARIIHFPLPIANAGPRAKAFRPPAKKNLKKIKILQVFASRVRKDYCNAFFAAQGEVCPEATGGGQRIAALFVVQGNGP